jgi:hypothetical protein
MTKFSTPASRAAASLAGAVAFAGIGASVHRSDHSYTLQQAGRPSGRVWAQKTIYTPPEPIDTSAEAEAKRERKRGKRLRQLRS